MKNNSSFQQTIPLFQRSDTRFILAAVVVFLVMVFISLLMTVYFNKHLIEIRKQELKRLVTVGRNTIEPVLNDYSAGRITKETALREVTGLARRMTYEDPTMQNYLFMSSYTGIMLVQPFEPEKEGGNQWDLQGSRGTYIIRSLIEKAKEGAGYVSYYYPPPGSEVPELKISYVEGIDPLQCYIGTGMYIGDVQAVLKATMLPITIITGCISIVFLGVLFFLTRPFLAAYHYLVRMFSIVRDRTYQKLPGSMLPESGKQHFRNAEARYLVSSFEKMMNKIEQNRGEAVFEQTKLRLLLENLPAYAFLKDGQFRYLTANKVFCDYVNVPLEDLIGKTDYEIFPRDIADEARREDKTVMATLELHQVIEEVKDPDGRVQRIINKRKMPILSNEGGPDGIIGLAFDITSLKQHEEQLKASLEQKDILLKEVHHRVKNNLQIISSLINLQIGTVGDDRYRALMQESSNRISSMATVHEMLYKSIELNTVNMHAYINEMARHLIEVYGLNSSRVQLVEEITITELDLDKSIPAGLIITELISNSIKYAFPEGRGGTITVKLNEQQDGYIELVVRDDGVGLPPSVLSGSVDSLGLLLVNALTGQLEGALYVENREGAYFSVVFPK
jgi:PAS domain S-box-containing protein